MKSIPFATVAQLAVFVVACAYADALPAAASTAGSLHHPHYVVDSAGRKQLVYRNANSCAPFHAHAVWGPGRHTAHPLGYQCERHSNG